MKGAMSAQKACQEFETKTRELLGGKKEYRESAQGTIELPFRQSNDFLKKAN